MKRTFQIVSLILLALMPMSITTAQEVLTAEDIMNAEGKGVMEVEQYSEGYLLDNYPGIGISGDFAHLLKIEDYNRYLRRVSRIKRVDSKTLLLSTSSAEIKVTIDKGRISIRNPFKCGPCESLPNAPIETKYWIADNLKEEDKDITVSVYKSNTLLGKFTYDFKKDVTYGLFTPKFASEETKLYTVSENFSPYTVEFHFFQKDGTEKFINNYNKEKLSNVDYDKPMTVLVRDYWGKKSNVIQFSLCSSCGSYENEAYVRCDGQPLSGRAIKLMKHFNDVQIIEVLCQGRNGEPCSTLPLSINK